MSKLYDFTGSLENPMVSFRSLAIYDVGIRALLDNKVDKVEGKDLVSNEDISQITTNKDDLASLRTDVESLKTQGADSEQVTTNKNNITDLQTRVTTLETQLNQILTTLNNWV